jgi:TetR/AcrR family transcriptional regulator, tetracycline repressor protein
MTATKAPHHLTTGDEKSREKLTRERICEAALQIMDAEGLDAVSMRRVAREVGVEAMSLYHYVKDKEDLLDGICSLVMGEFRYPDESQAWLDVAKQGAREWRRILKQHPNVIALFAERQKPMTDIAALGPMEFALRVIGRAGIDERETVLVFNVLGGYIMGSVMMEVGRMFNAGAMDKANPDVAATLVTFPAKQLPCIAASMPHLAACDPNEQFETGLDLLLKGLMARYGTPADA